MQSNSNRSMNQIWNDNTNLNKFSSKKDSRNKGAFKLFRRPSTQTANVSNQQLCNNNNNNNANSFINNTHNSSLSNSLNNNSNNNQLNIVDTVSKVADKAVSLVDQSLNSINSSASSSSLSTLANFLNNSNFYNANNIKSLIEFSNCVNRLCNSSLNVSSSSNTNGTFSPYSTAASILNEFDEQFHHIFPQLSQDLNRQIKQFVDRFLDVSYKRINPNEVQINSTKQAEIIQDFYKKIHKYILTSASIKSYLDRIIGIKSSSNTSMSSSQSSQNLSLNGEQNENFNSLSQQQQNNDDAEKLYEAIMIMVEYNVNNNIYDYVFPTIMSEFEEQDMKLQKRIRDFYWITNEMIGTCIDENSIFYRESYEEALNCKLSFFKPLKPGHHGIDFIIIFKILLKWMPKEQLMRK